MREGIKMQYTINLEKNNKKRKERYQLDLILC